MDYIQLQPIAFVRNSRTLATDDNWEEIISEIELAEHLPTEALDNIELFSHLEIIYFFDKANDQQIKFAAHPRENLSYPNMGILAQRKKDRPNHIGLCSVELVSHNNRILTVKYLDAIDGTPILDIKPVMKEFQIKSAIRQPNWVSDLMKNYW